MSGPERVLAGLTVAAVVWLALETHEERLRLRRQEAARGDQATEPAPQARDELAERRARRPRRSA